MATSVASVASSGARRGGRAATVRHKATAHRGEKAALVVAGRAERAAPAIARPDARALAAVGHPAGVAPTAALATVDRRVMVASDVDRAGARAGQADQGGQAAVPAVGPAARLPIRSAHAGSWPPTPSPREAHLFPAPSPKFGRGGWG